MKLLRTFTIGLTSLAALAVTAAPAHAWWSVGVRVGGPCCYRPYGWYRPYPFVVAPTVVIGTAPAVVAAPAPVIVQPVPAYVQAVPGAPVGVQSNAPPAPPPPPAQETAPPPTPVPPAGSQPQALALPPQPVPVTEEPRLTPVAAQPDRQQQITQLLGQLASPDERVRLDSVNQLGHMRAQRAVDPLAATLAGDRSPAVREAAARALALIRNPKAMPALQRAAMGDPDHDVRRSAQFAVEIIQSK